MFGDEAKLRPNRDPSTDLIVIPNPIQTSLSSGLVVGWQVFVKILSIEYDVFLQVWRPSLEADDAYTLVGQTVYQPKELRFHELTLDPDEYLPVEQGDVLGFYHPHYNPLPWSSVPCAYLDQIHKYAERPVSVEVGRTVTFRRAARGEQACRQYSFAAIMAPSHIGTALFLLYLIQT